MNVASTNGKCRLAPRVRGVGSRCASAMRPPTSTSSTSTARSCRPCTRRARPGASKRAAWDLQTQLISFLEEGWERPDDGIWEVRGPRRHFTHSKVMAWVAVDRAVRTMEDLPELEGPLEEWRALRTEIHEEVCSKGFNGRQRLHPVLRLGPARREHPHDAPLRVPACDRPASHQHHRSHRAGAGGGGLRAPLPNL